MANQLHESHLVRKGVCLFTELYFSNIKCTSDMEQMLTVEMQIAMRAKEHPKEAMTNLHGFIDEGMLHRSFAS